MTTWQIITMVLSVLFGAGWATMIPIFVKAGNDLKKTVADYKTAVADGTITDAERIELANDLIADVENASQIIQFIHNLISSIKGSIKQAELRVRK